MVAAVARVFNSRMLYPKRRAGLSLQGNGKKAFDSSDK
jgi:hypothetical protein